MPLYRIKAPNGQTYQIEGPEGATQDDVIAAVLAQHPEAGNPPPERGGVISEGGRGAEQMLSSGIAGFKSIFGDANEAAREALERQQGIQSRYGDAPSLAGVTDTYQKEGLGAAAKRVLGDVPRLLAQQAPQLAATLGAAKLGAMAGAPLGPVGSMVGGGAGAALSMFPQLMGSNVTTQAQEQLERGEDVNVNTGRAAAGAAAQTAIETAGTAFVLGKGLVKSVLGIKSEPTKMAGQALLKKAQATLTGTVVPGAARGLAEIPVEVAQQIIERAQAGQDLTSDDAYEAYGEAAYAAGIVGPAMGGVGNVVERSQARGQVRDEEERKRIEETLARIKAPQQPGEPTGPDNLPGILAQVQDLQAQITTLSSQRIAKPTDEVDKATNAQIDQELKALREQLKPLAQVLAKNRDAVAALRKQPEAAQTQPGKPSDDLFGGMPIPEEPETDLLGGRLQRAPAEEPTPEKPWTRDELETQWNTIEDSINTLREQARGETDVGKLRAMADQIKRLENARRPLDEALSNMEEQPLPPAAEKIGSDNKKLQARIKALQKQADDAGENGDVAARLRALEKLQTIQQENAQAGLFTPDADATRAAQAEALGQEVGAVREEREGQRRAYDSRQQEEAARQERLRELVAQMRAATSAQEERRLQAEIEALGRNRMNAERTDQVSLFDDEVADNRVNASGTATSREQLLFNLAQARRRRNEALERNDQAAYNRATQAAQTALENLRAQDERTAQEGEQAQLETPRQDTGERTLAENRIRAFREFVDLINKSTRGRANPKATLDAEKAVVDSLLAEAEAARGAALEAGERAEAERDARLLLRELRARYGDTRSDIDIGTRDEPNRIDESAINTGYRSMAAQGEYGISRFESQPPGFRTFSSPSAAAESILEGLDQLRNKLASPTRGKRVETTFAGEVSAKDLATQVERAKRSGRLSEQDQALLDDLEGNLPAFSAQPEARQDAAQWLNRLATGNQAPELAGAIRERLNALEKGKRSETEGTRRATQGELLPGTQDNVFDSFEEFDEALASPELAAIRKEAMESTERIQAATKALTKARENLAKLQADADKLQNARANADGITREAMTERLNSLSRQITATQEQIARMEQEVQVGPTASAVERTLRGLRERMAALQKTLDDARALEGDVMAGPRGELAAAEGMQQGVARNLAGLKREVEVALQPFEQAFFRAFQSVARIQNRSLELARALRDNLEAFDEYQVTGLQAQSTALRDVEQAKRRLKATVDMLVSQREKSMNALEALATDTSMQGYRDFAQERDFAASMRQQAEAAHTELLAALGRAGRTGLNPQRMQDFLREDARLAGEIRKNNAQWVLLSKARNRVQAERVEALGRILTPDVKAELARREEDAAIARQIVEDARAGVTRTEEEFRALIGGERFKANVEANTLAKQAREAEARLKRQREQPARDEAVRGTLEEQAREEERKAARAAEQGRLERAEGPQQTAEGERVLDEAGGKVEGTASTLGARRVTFPETGAKTFSSSKYLRMLDRALNPSLPDADRAAAQQELQAMVERGSKMERNVAEQIQVRYERIMRKREQVADLEANNPGQKARIARLRAEIKRAEDQMTKLRGTMVEELPTRSEAAAAKRNLDRETRGLSVEDADQEVAEIAERQRTRRATSPVMEDTRTKRKFESTKVTKESKPVGNAKKFRPGEELAYRQEQLDTINRRLEEDNAGPVRERLLDAQKRLQDRIRALEDKLGTGQFKRAVDVGDALFQQAIEGDVSPLSKTATQALEADNLVAALNDVANNSKIDLNKRVAQRLRRLLGDTTVILDPNLKGSDGKPGYGAASADGMTIWLNPSMGLNEETLLHEAVHAATERMLNLPESQLTQEQLAAKRELTALFKSAQNDPKITSANAKKSISEFVAEAMSNNQLQTQLYNKPWRLQNAWSNFKRVLLNLLGINTPPQNALEATLAAADTIFAAPKRGGAATPAQFRNADAGFQSIVAQERTAKDKLKANLGLAFRTQFVDRNAPVEKLAGYFKDPLDALQTMYYTRIYGQRMSLVGQAVSNGALNLKQTQRADGRKEWMIESQKGTSLKDVMAALRQSGITDPKKLDDLFTKDLVGRRAARVGWDKLNFNAPADAKAQVEQARAEIDRLGARKAFDEAAALYNDFNKGMMQFMVQTGAIGKDTYKDLTEAGDYVPFYRQREGNAELVIGKETPIRIGNLKDSPHLQELVGGDDAVMPFSTSAVQNVSLLTDLAVRNVGMRNLAYQLASMKMGKFGKGNAKGPNVIEFKDNNAEGKNEDKYLLLDSEVLADLGIPADLLVKGLAGIPTMLPGAFRLLALPSQILRKTITLSPLYAARQLFRDSMAAAIVSGANFTPVVSAMRQLGKKSATQRALEQRGVTGGQVFTGTGEDVSKLLRDLGTSSSPMRILGKLEAMSMEADAATRRAQYDSYIKQGLSEMEATFMSLESMNFTRQGLSPSVHAVSQLVPFLNAQIQGLDVLYRAARGRMPMNKRLDLQGKMLRRGALLAASTVLYALGMQDDEAYKNATAEERAMNWFVRVPGIDESLRIPIPFEIGYIFKALPEALVNLATGAQSTKESLQTLNRIAINTLPGGSNALSVEVNGYHIPTPLILPAAFKPAVEFATGTSLFTRRPIVPGAQQGLMDEYQYTDRTSEIAKDLGQAFGMSPAILENTIRGYFSGTGVALMQLASMAYGDTGGPERAARRLSELPLVGAAFQPKDGLQLVNNAYDRIKEIEEVKRTYDSLIKTGERAEAERFLQEHLDKLVMADTAGNAKTMLNRLVQMERAVKAADLGAEEKRQQLDELRRVKIELAASLRDSLGTR